jgi:hypothetical protein
MEEEDRELRQKLRSWRAPETPASLDRRVVESYRRRRSPWWQRAINARIEVPVPLFVAAQMLLAAAIWTVSSAPELKVVVPASEPAVLTTMFEERGFRPLPQGKIRLIKE